jgi:crotonobetainyl-CoA:carnitine CoA-transferase CaiB-like acyl-CoA transferase
MSADFAPLSGVRVLDLSTRLSGALSAMLLADQGADVVAMRQSQGLDIPESLYAVIDRNKRVISKCKTIDPLVAGADILICDQNEVCGQDIHTLRRLYPTLVLVQITAFAQADEFLFKGDVDDGVLAALSGQFTDLHPMRELFGLPPVYTSLPLASVYAAMHAASATVLALTERLNSGQGVNIHVNRLGAALSAMASMYQSISPQPARYDTPRLPGVMKTLVLPAIRFLAARADDKQQAALLATARKSYPALMSSYACADGLLIYVFAVDNWKLTKTLLDFLELTDSLLGEGYVLNDPYMSGELPNNLSETSNLSRRKQARLKGRLSDVFKTRSARHWLESLRDAGIPCAIQKTTSEWIFEDELLTAGLMVDLNDPLIGNVRQPGLQCWLESSNAELAMPAPRQIREDGQTTAWHEPSISLDQHTVMLPRPASQWLKGVRVLDISTMVAGPVAARALAEYGAEVTKIEAPNPNHGPRMTCWYGADVNRGKRSVIIDLKVATGRALFAELVERSDVLVTNHTPGAMEKLGLSPSKLREMNAGLVICRIGAFNGPHRGKSDNYAGYDPVLQAASGIMSRYGEPGAPDLHGIASCVDALTGFSALFGVALALNRRAQSGKGDIIDTALAAAASLVQLPFAHSAADGEAEECASGQSARGTGVLSGLYRLRDGWIYIGEQVDCAEGEDWVCKSGLGSGDSGRRRLADFLTRKSSRSFITELRRAGIAACRVSNVAQAQAPSGPVAVRRRMNVETVAGLGRLSSLVPEQLQIDGQGLKPLRPAEKSGASTLACLTELGIAAFSEIIAEGSVREQLHRDFLPT